MLAGCALSANPQPPTLWLPEPVHDLTALRVGDQVQLRWTMPRRTTDKVALKGDQKAHVCWTEGIAKAGTKTVGALPRCQAAGDGMFAPNKPAAYTVTLPGSLISGTPRAVSFYVELENHAGKTAGPSNAGVVATGAAPAAVTGFRAQAAPAGVALHWEPATTQTGLVLRLHRTLVQQKGAAAPNEANGVPPAEEQTLEVDLEAHDAGEALDRDAALNHTWSYTAQRVRRVRIDGDLLEIAGLPSGTITLSAKDIFPPAVPQGLAAVADAQAHVIDLSWMPDRDADLAGYFVYRREVRTGAAPERISPATEIVSPAFEDRSAVPGHRYAYSVSSVDHDGNESARSAEVQEELPQ